MAADFDLSAVMRFDGSEAVTETHKVEDALDDVANAQKKVGDASTQMASKTGAASIAALKLAEAEAKAALAASNLANAEEKMANSVREGGSAQVKAAADLARAKLQAASAGLALSRAESQYNSDGTGVVSGTNARRAAMQNLSFQIQDIGAQLSTVSGPSGLFRIFAQQGGQIFSALNDIAQAGGNAGSGIKQVGNESQDAGSDFKELGQDAIGVAEKVEATGGKFAAVAGFLSGPWGAALLVAGSIMGPFIAKLFEADNASDELRKRLDQAASAADSFGNAQSLLGKVIDLTTGKLKTQNQVLVQTIKLQAQANIIAAQREQQTATDAVRGIGATTIGENLGSAFSAVGATLLGNATKAGDEADRLRAKLAPLNDVVRDYIAVTSDPRATTAALDKGLDATMRRLDQLSASGKLAGRDLIEAKETILDLARTINDQRANKMVLDAINGNGIDPALKPYARDKKPKAPKAAKAPASTDGLVARVREDVASLTAEFTDAPTYVEKARAAVAKLDRDIAELQKKKPPNFEALIASAEAAKGVIQDNIAKPYDDFIRDQAAALEIQKLTTAGRIDEANALKAVQQLQAQMGPLTNEQKDAVLATVQAMREQQREAELLREKQQKYLDAIQSTKAAFQGLVTGGLQGIEDFPKRLLDAFTTLKGQQLFEKLFGSVFRDLQDQANGTAVVKDASDRMAAAVDKASKSISALGDAAAGAAGNVGGAGSPIPGAGSTSDTSAENLLSSALAGLGITGAKAAAIKSGGAAAADGGIVVNGERTAGNYYASMLSKVTTQVAGNFLKPESAKIIGDKIGKFAGKGLEGAATGAMVNSFLKPLGNALGVKTSQTGAQIGGAIGSFVPIPGGDIIGSVIGSVVGGMFKKTKSGAANITSGTGAATTYGNSKGYQEAASAAASSIQDGLAQIAEQLGGTVGGFNVTIGQRHGDWRVRTGTGSLKVKAGAKEFDDDQEGAIAYAMQLAITQGAITGLSAAMQQALRSSPDLNTAIKEALGVQEVEQLLGGLGASLKSVFTDFDKTAAERVRIAQKYGLDVLAVEKINAEQREELIEATLKSRIGSLQDFLDSVKYGDLFEGSASERRAALLDQIASVTKDAEAGKDGAADQLQQLFAQLLNTSKEAYGTAGVEYSSDRATALSEIARIIQMETDRVNEAAGASTSQAAATAQSNTLLDEANALAAQANTTLQQILAALTVSTIGTAANTALTAR